MMCERLCCGASTAAHSFSAHHRHEIAAKAVAQQNADSHFLHGKWAESTAIFVNWRLQRAEKEAPVVGITPWAQGPKAAKFIANQGVFWKK